MPEMTDKCAHSICHCPARMENGYCSEYCEHAEDELETGCRCDHPECHLAQASVALSH